MGEKLTCACGGWTTRDDVVGHSRVVSGYPVDGVVNNDKHSVEVEDLSNPPQANYVEMASDEQDVRLNA